MKKLIFFSITILLFWLGVLGYNGLTDGFSLYQISSSLPPCPQFNVSLDSQKKEELQKILNQEFRYLAKGCQFYVFQSADGEYVLKFFKHKHLRQFDWLNKLWMPQKLRKLCDDKVERRQKRVELLFKSCHLAYEKMHEETALLFIHLNRIPALEKSVVIRDKMGFKHTILIDEHEYFIQKMGEPAGKIFAQIAENEIPVRLKQLSELVLERCRKGICDRDKAFIQNVAFSSGRAFFTDIGQFYEDPCIVQEDQQVEDLRRRLASFQIWYQEKITGY